MDGQSRMGGSYLKIVTGINLENTAGEYKRWSEIGRRGEEEERARESQSESESDSYGSHLGTD